jgi:biopolymer transport protein ExbD
MNFYTQRRRTPVLQIISMIDILIILLIFLVVSTTFKEKQKKDRESPERSVLNVSIPVSEALDLGTDRTERVSLTVTKDGSYYLADAAVPADTLIAALTRFRAQATAGKLDLRIDENASFATIIKVWDALTQAGYKVGDVPARVLRRK